MRVGLVAVCLALALAAPPRAAADGGERAVIVQIKGQIDDYNRDALFRRFDEARKLGAKIVILDVDSYGGLLTSGLEISRFIKRQDDLHTIAFVQDKAVSAGAMIAMACDEIVMSDSSSLGDCAPIIFGIQGLEALPPAERAKQEAPVLLDFDESAVRNHHDRLLAAAMVDVNRTAYWVQNDSGERRFVDAKEYADLLATKHWRDVPGETNPIKGSDTLLIVNGAEAVQYGLATGIAPSAEALAKQRGYDVVADLTPGTGENIVEVLNGPIARGILIVIFLQCLYIVLHAPGHGVAETLGLVALGLMLGVPYLTGYAQWWEILLIFLGLALVALEILVPGSFAPGITGAILVIFGLVMTFVPVEPGGMPSFLRNAHASWLSMRTGVEVVAAAMGASMILWACMSRYLPKMPYFNRLILTATSGQRPAATTTPVLEGVATWPPPGAIGRAVSELRPGGSAEFFDPAISDTRITSVVSESGYLPLGCEVVVRQLVGPSIVVRKRDETG
jgi:membrane-bound serine protease (ClpP class)